MRCFYLISFPPDPGRLRPLEPVFATPMIKSLQLPCLLALAPGLGFAADQSPAPAAAVPAATIAIGLPAKPISPDLLGIFFEDINYAADGGLYAELVQNRSFEYTTGDNKEWNPLTAWTLVRLGDAKGSLVTEKSAPLNANNPTYAVLTLEQGEGVGLRNDGFDGFPLQAGERYEVSLFARVLSGAPGPLLVRLQTKDGRVLGEAKFARLGGDWKKHVATIKVKESDADARLMVIAQGAGSVGLDMISLFPRKTFHDRPNGLRPDLAQTIADLKPRFVRFPGGCLAHGDGLDNIYRWKDTIGPVEQRKAQRNIWRYHQTLGLGYFEYFQFCEDIGAQALPVVAAGVCCQNAGHYIPGAPRGQQLIPMAEMPAYIQDILDLIEYANGPASSTWGAKRAAAGHPKPFNLKYLGVGNEDQITPGFRERFLMLQTAIKAKHPEIVVVGTSGPAPDGADFEAGWKLAREFHTDMIDEHYYRAPEWFWNNLNRYDSYDRAGSGVYVGEYAAHDVGRKNTLRSALAEAAYLTSLERNADIVRLASYAPLLAKNRRTQWRPDMIYFDNATISPSVNYQVHKLFGHNAGDAYLPTTVDVQAAEGGLPANGILLGSWLTSAKFDDLKVVAGEKTVLDESFESDTRLTPLSGRWAITDGAYVESAREQPALSRFGFSDAGQGYTITLRAMKTGGSEGFLVGFASPDSENYTWWNLGGWNNTEHGLERAVGGTKSPLGEPVSGRIEPNRWYDIRIKVANKRIQCFLDGTLIHDVADTAAARKATDLAASCVRDSATGDVIVKLVSRSAEPLPAQLDLSALGTLPPTAAATVLTGDPLAENAFGQPATILPKVAVLPLASRFSYTVPPHSLSVIRFKPKASAAAR